MEASDGSESKLQGEFKYTPLLKSYSSGCQKLQWTIPFEEEIYKQLISGSERKLLANEIAHEESEYYEILNSCDPAFGNQYSVETIVAGLRDRIDPPAPGSLNFLGWLEGRFCSYPIQEPFANILRWLRCWSQSAEMNGESSAEFDLEILEAVRVQHGLIEAFSNLVIHPFLESPITTNKHLADPFLRSERQLKSLLSCQEKHAIREQLAQLDMPNSAVICWILASNREFFRSHLRQVLNSKDPTVTSLMNRSRGIDRYLPQEKRNLLLRSVAKRARQLIQSESNYLENPKTTLR